MPQQLCFVLSCFCRRAARCESGGRTCDPSVTECSSVERYAPTKPSTVSAPRKAPPIRQVFAPLPRLEADRPRGRGHPADVSVSAYRGGNRRRERGRQRGAAKPGDTPHTRRQSPFTTSSGHPSRIRSLLSVARRLLFLSQHAYRRSFFSACDANNVVLLFFFFLVSFRDPNLGKGPRAIAQVFATTCLVSDVPFPHLLLSTLPVGVCVSTPVAGGTATAELARRVPFLLLPPSRILSCHGIWNCAQSQSLFHFYWLRATGLVL